MTNQQLILVTPEGEVTRIDNNYESIRDGTEGTFDFARTSGTVGAYVGDLSLFEHKAFNVVASMIIGYPIWGSAVITRGDTDAEGETMPPADGVVEAALGMGQVWRVVREIAAQSQGQQLEWYPDADAVPGPTFIPMDDAAMDEWFNTGKLPEEARCDFVLDPESMACDAPAPHCIGGTEYRCDEHYDKVPEEES